jgi:16S rRNA (guanine(1405)-N(7))-methyltransferase
MAKLGPISSVLDIACGFNPLAIPWMNLLPGSEYFALDIYGDMLEFLNEAIPILGVNGAAWTADVVQSPPDRSVDVAFILKTLPCLEQTDRRAGLRLLDSLQARILLVSFPVSSLGGRQKGMPENYAARFREMISARPWTVEHLEFETELVFFVNKPLAVNHSQQEEP